MGTHLAQETCCLLLFCLPIIHREAAFLTSPHTVPARTISKPALAVCPSVLLSSQRANPSSWAHGEADKRGNSSLNQCWLIITTGGGERGFPISPIPPGSLSPLYTLSSVESSVLHSSNAIPPCFGVSMDLHIVLLKMMKYTRQCLFFPSILI